MPVLSKWRQPSSRFIILDRYVRGRGLRSRVQRTERSVVTVLPLLVCAPRTTSRSMITPAARSTSDSLRSFKILGVPLSRVRQIQLLSPSHLSLGLDSRARDTPRTVILKTLPPTAIMRLPIASNLHGSAEATLAVSVVAIFFKGSKSKIDTDSLSDPKDARPALSFLAHPPVCWLDGARVAKSELR